VSFRFRAPCRQSFDALVSNREHWSGRHVLPSTNWGGRKNVVAPQKQTSNIETHAAGHWPQAVYGNAGIPRRILNGRGLERMELGGFCTPATAAVVAPTAEAEFSPANAEMRSSLCPPLIRRRTIRTTTRACPRTWTAMGWSRCATGRHCSPSSTKSMVPAIRHLSPQPPACRTSRPPTMPSIGTSATTGSSRRSMR
jgi:hypothetical protein